MRIQQSIDQPINFRNPQHTNLNLEQSHSSCLPSVSWHILSTTCMEGWRMCRFCRISSLCVTNESCQGLEKSSPVGSSGMTSLSSSSKPATSGFTKVCCTEKSYETNEKFCENALFLQEKLSRVTFSLPTHGLFHAFHKIDFNLSEERFLVGVETLLFLQFCRDH